MSDAVAGGTGPHYYQELYTSPHEFDKLFLVDNYMQVSNDGGKTFTRMNESENMLIIMQLLLKRMIQTIY